MKLRYERGALADLDEIFSYVAADSRTAAARLVARIEDAARRIAATPYIGEATRNPRFRRLPVGNYLIVYEVGTDEGHSLRPPRRATAAVGRGAVRA